MKTVKNKKPTIGYFRAFGKCWKVVNGVRTTIPEELYNKELQELFKGEGTKQNN